MKLVKFLLRLLEMIPRSKVDPLPELRSILVLMALSFNIEIVFESAY